MALLILSFFAGVLTVAAPCILPLLPVIVGGSLVRDGETGKSWVRPVLIAVGLAVSVVLFTLLLKATTLLLGVPQVVWQVVSGVIVVLFGLHLLVPSLWERVSVGGGWYAKAQQWLAAAGGHKGHGGDLLLGAALGPIFTSCSPTYALIVATVLPASFGAGLLYLSAYAVGLAGTLLLVAAFGRAVTRKLGWFANPGGTPRKVIGVVFIVVGLMVITGLDKAFQAYVLEQGWYDPVAELEQRF